MATSQVGAMPKAQKVFGICSGRYKKHKKVPKHRKGVFRNASEVRI